MIMSIVIRCKNCKSVLIRGNKLTNAVKVYRYEVISEKPREDIEHRGIVCVTCGNFIPEDKLKEVFNNVGKH